EKLAEVLEVGVPTLRDILESLQRPGRDPREELPLPIFRTDVLKIEDLTPGMELQGTVRNVIDFGAFVDIGIKSDGLVHISQLSSGYVKHPMDVVSVGDNVTVWVLNVDLKKGRVGLTMRNPHQGE
ncbi:S1 RNA-binding domain-containing protein, partial [Paenibacillus sp. AR247]